jgi:DNA repair exonuclease SbcCD ATPase subunit
MDLGQIFAWLFGGGTATWIAVTMVIKGYAKVREHIIKSIDDKIEKGIKDAIIPIHDRLDRLSANLTDGCKRFEAIERVESEIKNSLLTEIRDITKDAAEWRDNSRREFVLKESIDGRILLAITDHCKVCTKHKHTPEALPHEYT